MTVWVLTLNYMIGPTLTQQKGTLFEVHASRASAMKSVERIINDHVNADYAAETMAHLSSGDVESAMVSWRGESGEDICVEERDVLNLETAVQELDHATSRQD
jgi:hypothetical protein